MESSGQGIKDQQKSAAGGDEGGDEDGARARAYPITPSDYRLLEEIGRGTRCTVYSALCLPYNELVAIKVLQFGEGMRISNDFWAGAKSRIRHPNVLVAHCSFAVSHTVWVVMPFMAGGSCLEIMKAAFADGFDETLVSTFLKESLIGLNHLHQHGRIHQDVKAGSILVDGKGRVQLADFGASSCMFDTGDQQQSRSTFLGSCCWMAPEVIERVHGYDYKADIWSFGITALELVHGVSPFSKYPMKVFFNALQNGTSEMDCAIFKLFSKSFKNMITLCLAKDPLKRPAAEQLLRHPFFKQAHASEHVCQHVLDGLSPLSERVKNLKVIEAAQLALKKSSLGDEKISQREYIRGVHNWICSSHGMRKTETAVTIFKGGPADSAPQMDVDWDDSCLQPKNAIATDVMDIIAERDAALMEKSTALAERLAAYAERDAAILQRDIATADRDSAVLNRDAALAALARLEKKSSGRARRPSQTTIDEVMNGSKILQRMDLGEHCTFAAEFRPDATPSTHAGIMVLDSESTHLQGVHRFSRDKESQIEIFVRTKRKATEVTDGATHRGKHPRPAPKKSRNWPVTHQSQALEPERECQAPAANVQEPGPQARELLLNGRAFRSLPAPTPIPYCSCTGMNQQCYRWGNGGWQSACCTTLISMFPLPLNPKKRGSRVAGRKMSAGAFDKLLEKLVSEGVNINLPVDLREHWAKHGTNRYVTLR